MAQKDGRTADTRVTSGLDHMSDVVDRMRGVDPGSLTFRGLLGEMQAAFEELQDARATALN